MMRSQLPKMPDFLSAADHDLQLCYVSDDVDVDSVTEKSRARNKPRNGWRKPQQEKQPARRSNSAGMESDTGSDGMGVNSGGSGRSGDWGPPGQGRRQRSRRKSSCPETPATSYSGRPVPSWYDSGISMSTRADSKEQSLTDEVQPAFVNGPFQTVRDNLVGSSAERHLSSSSTGSDKDFPEPDESCERKTSANLGKTRLAPVSGRRELSMTRSISCSFIPSPDAHRETTSPTNVVVGRRQFSEPNTVEDYQASGVKGSGLSEGALDAPSIDQADLAQPKKKLSDAQKQVLRQIYGRPAVQTPSVDEPVKSDDSITDSRSRFPLPEHLDYPLNLYRDNTDKPVIKSPIQRIKAKFRKGRSKSATQTPELSAANVEFAAAVPSQIGGEERGEEVDSLAILSRLANDPSDNKGIIKRLLDRIGGRSYSAHDFDADKSILGLLTKKILHSSSEDISTEFEAHFRPRSDSLQKSASMPVLDLPPNDDFYQFPNARNLANQVAENNASIVNSTNAYAYVSFRSDRSSGTTSRDRAGSVVSGGSSVPDRLDIYGLVSDARAPNPGCAQPRAFVGVPSVEKSRRSGSVEERRQSSSFVGQAEHKHRSSSAGSVVGVVENLNVDAKLSSAEDSVLSKSFPSALLAKDAVCEDEARKTNSFYDLYRDGARPIDGTTCASRLDGQCERTTNSYTTYDTCCRCCCHCGSAAGVAANAAMFHPQFMAPYYRPPIYAPIQNYSPNVPPMHNYHHGPQVPGYPMHAPPMYGYPDFFAGAHARLVLPKPEHRFPQADHCIAPHYVPGPTVYPYANPTRRADTDRVVAPLDVGVPAERKAERRKISNMIFDTFV